MCIPEVHGVVHTGLEEEKQRNEKEAADKEAASRAEKAAQLKREAEAAEKAAAEAKRLAEEAAREAGQEMNSQQVKEAEEAAKVALTSRVMAEQAEKAATAAAVVAASKPAMAPVAESPGQAYVLGKLCYKEIICAGGTGVFQRHNFDGLWRVGEDQLCDGMPRYEHRTPNGQMVHLFHVKSAYGGAPRWVIGPVPGNENG